MATLVEAVNQIIGQPGDECGFRYAVNHSDGETAGITAKYALTFKRKIEAPPILLMEDPASNFPGCFFEIEGDFPSVFTRGTHGEGLFTVKIYVVGEMANNTRPKEAGRELAVKVSENINASDNLNLDWVDHIEWRGLVDDPFTQQLHLVCRDYYAGGTKFSVFCKGITLND